ncbi:MAG TPA: tetratricopeptide repeat protein [Gallionellaceae bacterium]|nr:tetratricopeptide repeat protein [Gallionellaceae bacterium]
MSNHLQSLLQLAAKNDAEAQFELAEAYRNGDGTEQNFAEALRWYRAAAELGHADAQNNLGAMYLSGLGTEKNPAEAVRWYQQAAEQEHVQAQFNLGMLCLMGSGVEQSDEDAALWLHRAAEQGDLEAISKLGTLYQLGRGVEQNFVAAADLHTIAAMEGEPSAIDSLADYRDEIEQAALDGSIIAALCMAKLYDRGLGVEPDTAQVYAWFRWLKLHGQYDDAPDELDEWESYVNVITSEDDTARGNILLEEMRKRADGGLIANALTGTPAEDN